MESRSDASLIGGDSPSALIKVVLLGDSGVGKSSLLLRFCHDRFDANHVLTIGVDFKSKLMSVGGETVKLQIWDTAGQERFRNITPVYFRGALGVAMVFDVVRRASFDNVTFWMKTIEEHQEAPLAIVLIANKTDCSPEERIVTREEAQAFAAANNIIYIETSAASGAGVAACFESIADLGLKSYKGLYTFAGTSNTETKSKSPKASMLTKLMSKRYQGDQKPITLQSSISTDSDFNSDTGNKHRQKENNSPQTKSMSKNNEQKNTTNATKSCCFG